MPKNYLVEDILPRNANVLDTKSKNYLANDIKPKMGIMDLETNQTYLRTLSTGMSIGPGLLMIYTYPVDIDLVVV